MTFPPIVTLPLLACYSGLKCSIFVVSLFADSTLIICVSSLVCAQTTISGSTHIPTVTAIPEANFLIAHISVERKKLNFMFEARRKYLGNPLNATLTPAPFVDKGGVAGQNEKASPRVISNMLHAPHLCPNGGIGRRARFRTWFSQGSGGSSPLSGTKFNSHQISINPRK